ncbi:hypothetical protein LLG95_10630, partial [bacterium]|nr:hypothetical protein [bacterium]
MTPSCGNPQRECPMDAEAIKQLGRMEEKINATSKDIQGLRIDIRTLHDRIDRSIETKSGRSGGESKLKRAATHPAVSASTGGLIGGIIVTLYNYAKTRWPWLPILILSVFCASAHAERYVGKRGVYYLERFGAGQAHEIIGTTETAARMAAAALGGTVIDPATGYVMQRLSDAAAWRPTDAARFAKAWQFGATNGYGTYSNASSDGRYCLAYEVTSDRSFLIELEPAVRLVRALDYIGISSNARWRRDAGAEHKIVFDG